MIKLSSTTSHGEAGLLSSSTPYSTTRPPRILTLLQVVASFLFQTFIISLPSFAVRGVYLIGLSESA